MGPPLVGLAAVCWGLSGGIGGALLADGWSALLLALCRGSVGLLFALLWFGLRRESGGLGNLRLWLWSVIAGLGVAGNFTFYFFSIGEGSVAVAATLMYCAPIYVFLTAFALGKEASTPSKWGAIALAMVGIALLTGVDDPGSGGTTFLGIVSGLLSGLCYAVFIFAFRFAGNHGSPQATLLIAFAVLVILLAGPTPASQTTAVLTTPDWPLFLALGVLGAGLSFLLFVVGMRHTKPTVASMIALLEPVTAVLFGVALLDEALDGSQLVGLVLVLSTATALGVRSGAHA